jgi:hypothetical protein
MANIGKEVYKQKIEQMEENIRKYVEKNHPIQRIIQDFLENHGFPDEILRLQLFTPVSIQKSVTFAPLFGKNLYALLAIELYLKKHKVYNPLDIGRFCGSPKNEETRVETLIREIKEETLGTMDITNMCNEKIQKQIRQSDSILAPEFPFIRFDHFTNQIIFLLFLLPEELTKNETKN